MPNKAYEQAYKWWLAAKMIQPGVLLKDKCQIRPVERYLSADLATKRTGRASDIKVNAK